jgi:HPt (histidine-containing phosphotransfer) domain-containing protein
MAWYREFFLEPMSFYTIGHTSGPRGFVSRSAINPRVGIMSPESHDREFDDSRLDDLRSLGERSGEDLLGEVVELFLERTPSLAYTLGAVESLEDLPELARIAHGLKSSSGLLGAISLSALAGQLEQTAKKEQLQPSRELAARVEKALSEVEARLRQLVPKKV